MPKKPNAHGMQEYVPAGNGDASGEYADGEGSNKGFKAFKKPAAEKPTPEMLDAIKRFTSDQYGDIRKASIGEKIMRKRPVWKTEDHSFSAPHTYADMDITDRYKRHADELENFIGNSSFTSQPLYRGVNLTNKDYEKLKTGAVIDQRGISSWSTDKRTAEWFLRDKESTPNKVVFIENKGTNRGRSVADYTTSHLNGGENEVIQSASNKQRITGMEKRNGVTYVYVKEE